MSNERAIANLQAGREHYLSRCFVEARASMQRYRQAVDYSQFQQTKRCNTPAPQISVVIVSYQSNQALLDCIDSVLKQKGARFEVILVDNGGNQSVHAALVKLPILWIKPPVNLLPSEGRNVGAHFARSDILVFLDDDALMNPGYLTEACRAMEDINIVALRGRVLAKTTMTKARLPKQYDLGDSVCAAELNLEGNCVIRREAFAALHGFDPLLFGHEGKELTRRCRAMFPGKKIVYWPSLVIRHDYAHGERLSAKRERQAIAKEYLKYLRERTMYIGVSIVVRVGDNLAAADEFLASLAEQNTYKPAEVLLWAKDSRQALEAIRVYLPKIFIRVLPAGINTLGRIGQQAHYDAILIVDMPNKIKGDMLAIWLRQQHTSLSGALLSNKRQLATIADTRPDATLEKLAKKLGEPIPETGRKLAVQSGRPSKLIKKPTLNVPQAVRVESAVLSTNSNARNNKSVKVSVIIPVYNKSKTIQRAFDSILAIGRDDIECIFVDDLSTDGSRKIIDEICKKHNNAVSIYNKVNLRAGASRNVGLENAVGEYVFFLDADDYLNSSTISQLIQCADEYAVDLVRGKIEGAKEDGSRQHLAKEYLLHDRFEAATNWKGEESLWFYWYFTSNLYRRSFLNRNNIRFPEGVRNEDPIFLCKCYLYAKNITLYPSTTYIYSITETQKNRVGADFLKGWVYGYYSIYQLICRQKQQKAFFMGQFPSIEKHCINIKRSFGENDAVTLLNNISVMFKTFKEDINYLGSELTGLTDKKTVEFGMEISGKSARAIYDLLP